MSGTLLPSATKASPTVDYYLKNGDSPSFAVITTDQLIVNSVGGGNAVLVQSDTGDANMTIQGFLEANLTLDAPTSRLIIQSQDNAAASEIILRSDVFGTDANVNELIMSPNDPLYGAPTNLIQQNAYKPGGVVLRQSLSKEDGSDVCFTTLSTDFTGISQNIATTVLSVLDSNAMAVQSLSLQPNGATLSGPLEVQTGGITIGGKPVAKPSKVAYVGLVGTDITVAPGQVSAQVISADFAVQAGHTYRVSVQCSIANADPSTAQTNFTALYASTSPGTSVQQVSLGAVQNTQTISASDRAWSCVFVAVSDSATCKVECFNSSATDPSILTLNAANVANAPSVLVEDLGII